jgi:hypothetical protein
MEQQFNQCRHHSIPHHDHDLYGNGDECERLYSHGSEDGECNPEFNGNNNPGHGSNM